MTVRRNDGVREASADELRIGDAVLVNPGGAVPVDGVVISGHSFVDQARITGESMPVEKLPGAFVYAGTINQSGALEIRTERVGRDTSYGKIIEAVENAERSRAPVQQLADRLAGYLVYFASAAAALTFIITHDVRFDDLGDDRRGRMRDCRRHTAGDSRGHRPGCAARGHHQGRPLSGNPGPSEHCSPGQDRHSHFGAACSTVGGCSRRYFRG